MGREYDKSYFLSFIEEQFFSSACCSLIACSKNWGGGTKREFFHPLHNFYDIARLKFWKIIEC